MIVSKAFFRSKVRVIATAAISLFFTGRNGVQAQQTISINSENSFPQRKNRLHLPAFPDEAEQFRRFEANSRLIRFSQRNVNDTLLLDFFDNKKYKAVVRTVSRSDDGVTGITAQILNTQWGYCFISASDAEIFVSAELPLSDEYFSVKKVNGHHYLYRKKLSEVQPHACGEHGCTSDRQSHWKPDATPLRAVTPTLPHAPMRLSEKSIRTQMTQMTWITQINADFLCLVYQSIIKI